MCSHRNAYQPPPPTAAPSTSSQKKRSDGSAKQLSQVHVALLFLANSSSAEDLKSNIRATIRSGKVWMRMLLRFTASL